MDCFYIFSQDPLVKPITKILLGVAVITLLIAIFVKETPRWLDISKLTSNSTLPPWVIACMIIAFTRLRKRTKNLLKKFGWWETKLVLICLSKTARQFLFVDFICEPLFEQSCLKHCKIGTEKLHVFRLRYRAAMVGNTWWNSAGVKGDNSFLWLARCYLHAHCEL